MYMFIAPSFILQVTPPSTNIEPDWKRYEQILLALFQSHPDSRQVAHHLGIDSGQLCSFGFNPPKYGCVKPQSRLYRRFYSSILLFALIQEWPITNVCNMMSNVTRGQLQQLQKDAAVFCGMTVAFCKRLNWHILAACLSDFSGRLNFGVHKEVLPLVRLGPELTPARARVLLQHDICSARDVVAAGQQELMALVMETLPFEDRAPLQDTAQGQAGDKESGYRMRKQQLCERLVRIIISR